MGAGMFIWRRVHAAKRSRVADGFRRLGVEPLEQRLLLAGDTYLVNFQPAVSPVPNRYLKDAGEVFGSRGGDLSYGWSIDHTDVALERNLQADQRLDTLVQFHQNQKWEFALANGNYSVAVSIGDPQFGSTHTVNVEGVNYWTAVWLTANSFLTVTHQVIVSDGRLSIDQGLAGELATRINYVQIVGLPSGPNSCRPRRRSPSRASMANRCILPTFIWNPSDTPTSTAIYINLPTGRFGPSGLVPNRFGRLSGSRGSNGFTPTWATETSSTPTPVAPT